MENHDQLLQHLALQGDPEAFFSLVLPYLEQRYFRERKGGASHQDAQTIVLAEATGLLEQLQRVSPKNFSAWFDEHCTFISSPTADDQSEPQSGGQIVAETAEFVERCSKEFLRTGLEIRRKTYRRGRSFPGVLFRNRGVAGLLIAAASLGVVLLTLVIMAKCRTSVVISLLTPSGRYSFQLPPIDSLSLADEIKPAFLGNDSVTDTSLQKVSDSAAASPDTVSEKKPVAVPPSSRRTVKVKREPAVSSQPVVQPRKKSPAPAPAPPPPAPAVQLQPAEPVYKEGVDEQPARQMPEPEYGKPAEPPENE